ncbi:MAG: S66 peptidase family protein, partial [Actinomycetes bacterium]
VAPHVLARHDRLGYLAGDDADRAADLQAAWCDPGVAAIMCARGGYGVARMLDHLDWEALAGAAPTALLGSSDVTALHLAVGTRLGVVSYFGPMPAGRLLSGTDGADPATVAGLYEALCGTDRLVLTGPHARPLVPGAATGVTSGGTLSLLAAALGTGDLRPATGSIVLLEDVTEAPYRVDRMLTSLLRAGWFTGVAGIALGSWERCGEGVHDVLAERLSPLGVPVLAGLAVGHDAPQLTLPLGVPARLDADAGTLTVGPDPSLAPGSV